MGTKRIVVFVSSDLEYDQRVLRTVKALTELGCQLRIYHRILSNPPVISLPGVEVYGHKFIFRQGWPFYAEMNVVYFFYAIFARANVFWSVDLDTLPGVKLASIFRRKKIVLDAHEYFEESPEIIGKVWVQRVWRLMGWLFIRNLDLAITVNDQLASLLSQKYPVSFISVKNMPHDKGMQSRKIVKKIIWYQGALNKGRCLEGLIASLRYLPGFEVHIAGTGDVEEELKTITKSMSLEQRVVFWGRLQSEEMHKHAQEAFVGFNMLENLGESYYLSLANKFFDYAQAGLPSINPDFPAYKEYLGKFEVGITLESTDPEIIAAAVIKLSEDNIYYEKLVGNCLAAARVWNWEREKKVLFDGMSSLLS